jgi:hypothetical protein
LSKWTLLILEQFNKMIDILYAGYVECYIHQGRTPQLTFFLLLLIIYTSDDFNDKTTIKFYLGAGSRKPTDEKLTFLTRGDILYTM